MPKNFRTLKPNFEEADGLGISNKPKSEAYREYVRAGAAGARTRRSLGHHLLHPLILRLLVLCAPAVLRTRALQDAPAPADPNS